MAPKKTKAAAVSLDVFLGGSSGSWADDTPDLPGLPPLPSSSSSTSYSSRPSGQDSYASSRPPREELPVPDSPPFTAYLGNLAYSVTENDIRDFFNGLEVISVRLAIDRLENRPKGYGYAEFETRKDLESALSLDNSSLGGRVVHINVAQGRDSSRGGGAETKEWKRRGPLTGEPDRPARSDSYDRAPRRERTTPPISESMGAESWVRKGPARGGSPPPFRRGPRDATNESPSSSAPTVRKKLDLLPRSSNPDSEVSSTATSQSSAPRSSPFGSAKPVDSAKKELEILQKHEAEKPVEEKPSEETAQPSKPKANPFGAAQPVDTRKRESEVEEESERQRNETLKQYEERLAATKAAKESAKEEKQTRRSSLTSSASKTSASGETPVVSPAQTPAAAPANLPWSRGKKLSPPTRTAKGPRQQQRKGTQSPNEATKEVKEVAINKTADKLAESSISDNKEESTIDKPVETSSEEQVVAAKESSEEPQQDDGWNVVKKTGKAKK